MREITGNDTLSADPNDTLLAISYSARHVGGMLHQLLCSLYSISWEVPSQIFVMHTLRPPHLILDLLDPLCYVHHPGGLYCCIQMLGYVRLVGVYYTIETMSKLWK